MEVRNTYVFEHKSHWNEFSPDVHLEFGSHMEDGLDELIRMVVHFFIACGYSEEQIRCAMTEYIED